MKGKVKRMLVVLLMMAVCLPSLAFAARQEIDISGYSLQGFDKTYVGSASGQTFTNTTEKLSVNGRVAFCIQSGYRILGFDPGGGEAKLEYEAEKISAKDSLQNKIAYLGWYGSDSKTDRDYAFTQMYLWHTLPDVPASGNATVRYVSAARNSEYERWKKDLDAKLAKWDHRPSFDFTVAAEPLAVKAGTQTEIVDTADVLADYSTFNYVKDGVSVAHRKGENKLTVMVAADCRATEVTMTSAELIAAGCHKYESTAAASYLYTHEKSQDLATYGSVEPIGMELRFNIERIKAKVQVIKKDATTGKTIPLAGTAFVLTELASGKQLVGPADGCFVTDEEGSLELPFPLYYGQYRLTEKRAPFAYGLSEPLDFTVDGSSDTLVLTVFDEPQQGRIRIFKEGERLQSFRENADGTYTPVFAAAPLAGAEFELRAAEDIVTPEGTLRARKGELMEVLETGEDGYALSGLLFLGKYELIEIESGYGHVCGSEPQVVELKYAGQEAALAEADVALTNERQKARITFTKSIEEDASFGLTAEEACRDIRFGLFAAEEIAAEDGSVLPAGGLLAVSGVEMTEQGYYGEFKVDIPPGRYYAQEFGTDEHYLLDGKRYPLDFVYQEQEAAAVCELVLNEGRAIDNELIRGRIVGHKTGDGGKKLAGASFGLFAAGEEAFAAEDAILTATSDENGSFAFENVPYGDWLVRELSAPAGYLPSAEVFSVRIDTEGALVEIEAVNEPKIGYAEFMHQAGRSGSVVFLPPETDDQAGRLGCMKALAAAALAVWAALTFVAVREPKHRDKQG